ncbi:MAG: ThiF family adenylyltransferase [Saprospiraceae bacterium]|nr:ThiF family adenylyltransferase [Saprospiraceae bacterium]
MNTIKNNTRPASEFSLEEKTFYARHLVLPELGLEGQLLLKAARVLVVGAGGLGSPLLWYLAAAGVGHIGIVDGDVVDISNLHRQVLYTIHDLGQSKAEVAQKRLQALNPHIQIQIFPTFLTNENALEIIHQFDIVADGTDNFPTRYLINDACILANKVNVYASIFKFEGQVSVFNQLLPDGTRSPNYRDLYPTPPAPDAVPNCAESGVLGVLPGIIGCIQANEVLKIITNIGEILTGKILIFDAITSSTQIIKIKKNIDNASIINLIDYEAFCDVIPLNRIQSMSAAQLYDLQKSNADFQLIDVREPHEYAQDHLIGGELIPLREITKNLHKISREKIVIFYCQTGKRSKEAINFLIKKDINPHLYNLEGGIIAFQNIIIGRDASKSITS